MLTVLKLALVPLVVWLASLAGRRWGHTAAGWISGLPIIAAPLALFLALDYGPAFAADTARAMLRATPAITLHCLVFVWMGARTGSWLASLVAAWAAFLAAAWSLGALGHGPWLALAVIAATTWLALRLAPSGAAPAGPAVIPSSELAVRVIAAFGVAAAVMLGAATLGPTASGILLTFPISGSVLPPFTLALHGLPAAQALVRAFIRGLAGFALFFFALATLLEPYGLAVAFLVATAACGAASEIARRATTRRRAR